MKTSGTFNKQFKLPPSFVLIHGRREVKLHFIAALYNLEDDWRNIVYNSDQLSEKQQQQQTALWELAQTEVAYIKTLKVVTDVSTSHKYLSANSVESLRPSCYRNFT